MEPTVGHFAKVNHEGIIQTVMMEELSYHNGKMDYIRCASLDHQWGKAFTPAQILEVIENPNVRQYLAEQAAQHARVTRYTTHKTTLVKMEYEDGYLNGFD